MQEQNEMKHFIKLFLTFIGIEMLLYTLIVYFDVLGVRVIGNVRKDPAFMMFYGLSAIAFFYFISKLDKKR